MNIKIGCPCGCKIEISSHFKNKNDIICPNCGKALPEGATEEIREIFKHYSALQKILIAPEPCYELKII